MPLPKKHTRFFRQYISWAGALRSSLAIHFRGIAGASVAVFFIAIPFIAEQSLPGDTLYPIKVRFNEGVRSQLLFSPYEKMQWETKRVERRVAEARLLVREGKLTEAKENALEETVRSHTTAFQAQLAELRESDATGATIAEVTLESALDVQSAVLDTQLTKEASSIDSNEGDVSGLVAIVREARADIGSSTDAASGTASYEPLAARVEENTTRIHALSQSLVGELTETQKIEIGERTLRIEDDILASKRAHEASEDDEAIPLLRNALATTEKIVAFMSSLELRSHVSLNALVPQQGSDIKIELEKTLEMFKETHTSLVTFAEMLEEPQRIELEGQLETLARLLEESKNEMTLGDLKEVERLVLEAKTLITAVEEIQSR